MRFINPRWRKVIRDMWSNKTRTLLVVLSMAVGIFAIGVVSGSKEVLVRELNTSFMSTNPPNAMVVLQETISEDMIETVGNMREVEDVEGKIELTLSYKINSTDEWKDLEFLASDDYTEVKIAKPSPITGDWPPDTKDILLERTSIDWMGVGIGDSIIVKTGDNKERLMQITGVVHDQNGPPTALSGRPKAYVNFETLEWLGEEKEYTRLHFTVTENKTDKKYVEEVGKLITRKIEYDGSDVRHVRIFTYGEHPVNDILEPLLLILTGIGVLSLVLSGFLVINTVSALLAQQTRQIGIMKAIGATGQQIASLYFATVLFYGLLSLLLAIPMGALGAWGFTSYMASFFNFDLVNFSIPPSILALQIGTGLMIPLIVAIYPIVSGTRITCREAINDYGVSENYGKNWIDRLLQQIRGVSRPLMLSFRNTFRRKTRLSLTLLTLTLAGATFITIFSVRDSVLATLDDTLNYWNYDIDVRFEAKYRLEEIERAVTQIPGVEEVESWGYEGVTRVRADGEESDSFTLIAPEADTDMLNPTLIEGRWLLPTDTQALVVNSDFLNDEPDLGLNDIVVLKINNRNSNWTIVGITQGTMVGAMVYANQPYYAQMAKNVGKSNVAQISTLSRNPKEQAEIAKQLEEHLKTAGLKVGRIQTIPQLQEKVETRFNFLISFLLAMAVVLAVVGGLGLMGTMSINVLERIREIGVMRAIGASDWAILRLVIIEGMLIGMFSWGIGAGVAFPLSWVLSNQIGVMLFQNPLNFAYSFSGLAIWLMLATILAGVASFMPARGASKVTVREVLAYE
ncbi:ABC transporter permease [Anaerolineales bacterium HSG6]|nr:ABC transporter permease [Anaerolineales bacterium HSG6]MDM8532152.1 ABC transporter permease [Anaerolineales bacterium HSG25]